MAVYRRPHLRATERRFPYGITQCYLPGLPPDTGERIPLGRYSIYLPRRDGRLSWSRRLVTYRDGLPLRRQSLIQVLTPPGVE